MTKVSSPGFYAVTVSINGVNTRIIGTKKHGTNPGVIFYPRAPLNLEIEGGDARVKSEHVTIRLNANPDSIHIHHTYELDHPTIETIDNALLNTKYNKDFAVALMARSIPILEERPTYICDQKRYKEIALPPFDKRECMLIVCYSVCAPGTPCPQLSHLGIGAVELVHENITIQVHYTYLNVPTYYRGREVWKMTAMPRVNKVPNDLRTRPEANDGEFHADAIVDSILTVANAQVGIMIEGAKTVGLDIATEILPLTNSFKPARTLLREGAEGFASLGGWCPFITPITNPSAL